MELHRIHRGKLIQFSATNTDAPKQPSLQDQVSQAIGEIVKELRDSKYESGPFDRIEKEITIPESSELANFSVKTITLAVGPFLDEGTPNAKTSRYFEIGFKTPDKTAHKKIRHGTRTALIDQLSTQAFPDTVINEIRSMSHSESSKE